MSFAKVFSAQTSLLDAQIIDVEVDLSQGLHSFSIVGLPDKAVEEARDRMSAAIKNSGFKSPKVKNQKVVVSLAPADIRKEGPAFDVAIALGYLLAAEDIRFDPLKKIFLGELSLDGTLRPIRGALPLVRMAKEKGFKEVYIPSPNAREAAVVGGINIYPADTLEDVIRHINTKRSLESLSPKKIEPHPQTVLEDGAGEPYEIDMSDIKGQETAKRGLLIAAAGGHNVAMYGSAGTGKTMLAKAFRHLLPTLSFGDALDATSIHSIAGTLKEELVTRAPFRAPHHTSSYVALVGGGAIPKPGEITLAHRGVLFLDEFPEFDRRVIEALREPLEERVVRVARARGTAHFPAHFILVAAMNPCPCGNFGVAGKECTCPPKELLRYGRKLSGPIMDRIDIWVEVKGIDHRELLSSARSGEDTDAMRHKVLIARELQRKRMEKHRLEAETNSELAGKHLPGVVPLEADAKEALDVAAKKLGLSARAYHRLLRVARTIADLEGEDRVTRNHILEALQYRPKAKEY